ncbi:MAG: hydantoinase/oxoprolinase family protein, partial [Pseudomonadota bacterium]
MATKIRMGVDIGGTFTDVVLEGPEGVWSTKVLTSYGAHEDAILQGMSDVCAQAGIAPSAITQIIHGTTLATNALIERRGARTAFVTTEGFRDTIEMRTESRFEQYDLDLVLPEPLIPRHRRYTVGERVDAQGKVLREPSQAELETLGARLAKGRYEAIAIGFLHAYANPDHERLAAKILANHLPEALISLSSEVSPQMREYERFNTTIANAYIQPLMKGYLARLEARLAEAGAACPIFMIHSGGGLMSLESAAAFPVRLVESGPAGGAVFAADIAARHGLDKVLSFDMGGTTAKICLIKDAQPKTARVFEVARSYRFKKGSGMPISIPVIDMVEIGAGGGSVARRDAMGQVRVGPESAGSEPGPACYGRGGTGAAVTDADLVLGRLDAESFAGGDMVLDAAAAEAALRALGADAVSSAFAVSEVVDENMANAARVHAVENGEDLADYTMIAFGGAAPLHAARLCEKLGIAKCLVPEGAGVGSAIGFLRAPFSFEANRTVFMTMADFEAPRVTALFSEMAEEATAFVKSCDAEAEITCDYRVYMRYRGQGWEIPVPLSADFAGSPNSAALLALFEAEYARLFSRSVAGMVAEITVWSVTARSVKAASLRPGLDPGPHAPTEPEAPGQARDVAQSQKATRPLFDPNSGQTHDAQIIERAHISAHVVPGPALIAERETTLVVPVSRSVSAAPDGTLILEARGDTQTGSMTDVAHQVMWNRLIAIVEEQAQALIRTAFSTSVREAGDLSAGVYNAEGEMLAQAVTGTPGHVNAMADAVAHFIRRIPDMDEGDVYLTNDPWEGTGHRHDITV